MLVPELKRPVANARSFLGNHSAMTLIGGREIPRLAEPQRQPREDEPRDRRRVGQADRGEHRRRGGTEHRRLGMRDRGDAPDDQRDDVAFLGAEPVDHPAGEEKGDGVGELEREDDVGVVDLAPAELALQRRLQDPDDLPVDVVDRRREEQQRADHPAVPSDRPGNRRRSSGRRAHLHAALTLR